MELETWHDLVSIYIKSSRWQDAEFCLSKSDAISCYSASRLYIAGRYVSHSFSPHALLSAYYPNVSQMLHFYCYNIHEKAIKGYYSLYAI